MKRARTATRSALMIFAYLGSISAAARVSTEGPTFFTVRDSIEMTRLMLPHPLSGNDVGTVLLPSPDGRQVAFVTRKGNLQTGESTYTLWAYRVSDVERFTNDPTAIAPQPKLLASFATSTDKYGIEDVRWVDAERLALLGREGANPAGQVYVINLTGQHTRLTDAEFGVAGFDINYSKGIIVFGAYSVPDWSARNASGYAVDPFYPTILMGKSNPAEAAEFYVRYYASELESDRLREIEGEPERIIPGGPAGAIKISPDGKKAIIVKALSKLPAPWAEYEHVRTNPAYRGVEDGSVNFQDVFWMSNLLSSEYRIVDLATGSSRRLIDAPGGDVPRSWINWSPDGTKILLGPTYLPRDSVSLGMSDWHRGRLPLLVSTADHRVLPVKYSGWDPMVLPQKWQATWHNNARFSVEWEYSGRAATLTSFSSNDGRAEGGTEPPLTKAPAGTLAVGPVRFRIAQDLNIPPNIAVAKITSGTERLLSDLNPQLANRALGEAKPYSWTDRLGRRFTGALVMPPHFNPRRAYPLVIQGNGYYPGNFIVDGASDLQSPAAARAIASRDILVLQIPDERVPIDQPLNPKNLASYENLTETELYLAEVEGAIDHLVKSGLVDQSRIGLLGFSRISMRMQYALTFTSRKIAAAVIADGISLTPQCYSLFYGRPPGGGMDTFDSKQPGYTLIGKPMWGAGISAWLDRSYLFHLDKVDAAIRFEEYGTYQANCNWEIFSILRRKGLPTELVHIPLGDHVLKSPSRLYFSKEGNVDWFDFWLNDREDKAESKKDQYIRWRRLRAERRVH